MHIKTWKYAKRRLIKVVLWRGKAQKGAGHTMPVRWYANRCCFQLLRGVECWEITIGSHRHHCRFFSIYLAHKDSSAPGTLVLEVGL